MLMAATAFAEVKLPYTFNSGMMLQHGKSHPIWGMADPGETITVTFAGQRVEAVADDAGEWEVVLAPLQPNPDPQQMVIAGANTRTLNDIIVGEVWLAIGSGAMGRRNLKVPKGEQEGMYDTQLRCHMMPNANSILPVAQNFIPCMWIDAGERRFSGWSWVPFYFLRDLKAHLGMPVGLLNGAFARGGSPTSYMPYSARKYLQGDAYRTIIGKMAANDVTCKVGLANLKQKNAAIGTWINEYEAALVNGEYPPPRPEFDGETDVSRYPSSIYNIMINPVKRFPVAGCVVYLEKMYAEKPGEYFDKIGALIDGVREDFKRPELPMVIVNTVDVSSPDAGEIAGGRANVKVVAGVGEGGWRDALPPKEVAQSIFNAVSQLTGEGR
jgi:sialate O-acetylesterase